MGRHERWLSALGRAIRLLRTEQNVSPRELAATAGLEPARLEAIEAGQHDLRYDVLVAVAHALNIETSDLVTRADAEAKDGDA